MNICKLQKLNSEKITKPYFGYHLHFFQKVIVENLYLEPLTKGYQLIKHVPGSLLAKELVNCVHSFSFPNEPGCLLQSSPCVKKTNLINVGRVSLFQRKLQHLELPFF